MLFSSLVRLRPLSPPTSGMGMPADGASLCCLTMFDQVVYFSHISSLFGRDPAWVWANSVLPVVMLVPTPLYVRV